VNAPAKINLALVVGPLRSDGKHEVATVLQRVDLCDGLELARADELRVEGFADDTLIRGALEALAASAGVDPHWAVRIEKRIPVAAGLGGGSSDAATALMLANEDLDAPLPPERLRALAAGLGADMPFFLTPGPQLGTGDGSTLEPLDLAADHTVVLLLPHGAAKESTAAVYAAFDESGVADGFTERRAQLLAALETKDLAAMPPNDLTSSPLATDLKALGAFRADVSGAGPTVYGLFDDTAAAAAAAAALADRGRVWTVRPVASEPNIVKAPGQYLRAHRLRLSLWVAVVEGLLVLVHLMPHLVLYALAAVALAFWFGAARNYKSAMARQAAWVFAASQALAVLVPIVWGITKFFVAIALVVAIAIAALYFLFTEREKAEP
jgi:4-diphosphocytidyl-2-C-methyl-D-erythritol kinase